MFKILLIGVIVVLCIYVIVDRVCVYLLARHTAEIQLEMIHSYNEYQKLNGGKKQEPIKDKTYLISSIKNHVQNFYNSNQNQIDYSMLIININRDLRLLYKGLSTATYAEIYTQALKDELIDRNLYSEFENYYGESWNKTLE